MTIEQSKQIKYSEEDHFFASLLSKRCAGTLFSGERFGGILLSFDSESLIVRGGRGGRTLIRRKAIANCYEMPEAV